MERLPAGQKTAFVKSGEFAELITDHQNNEGLIERLRKVGAVPDVLMYATTEESEGFSYRVVMERIEGFDLLNIPQSEEEFKYSVTFAKKLARLFKKTANEGIHHQDAHGGNIMFDQEREDFVFVDLEELSDKPIKAREWVFDYCVVLGDVYFGMDPLSDLAEIHTLPEEHKKKLMPLYNKYGNKSFYTLLKNIDMAKAFVNAMDLQDVVNPQVLGFISDGLKMRISNFDGIFSVSPEPLEMQKKWLKTHQA